MGQTEYKELKSTGRGWEDEIQSWFDSLQAPQASAPDQPASRESMQRLMDLVMTESPYMRDFYRTMMSGGGLQSGGILDLANRNYQGNMQDAVSRILAQGRGGTGNMRALGRATGQMANENALNLATMGIQNQFGGAQGMMNMPGFIGAPSQIEQQMLGMKSRYDLANLQAEMSRQAQQANFYNNMWQTNWDSDWVAQPNAFQQYVMPILQTGAAVLPFVP